MIGYGWKNEMLATLGDISPQRPSHSVLFLKKWAYPSESAQDSVDLPDAVSQPKLERQTSDPVHRLLIQSPGFGNRMGGNLQGREKSQDKIPITTLVATAQPRAMCDG